MSKREPEASATRGTDDTRLRITRIPVGSIQPEEGLGRLRGEEGHRELRRSIERFGVLNPVTVRRSASCPDKFILVKGQGRTLACRMLGISRIPAIVLDDSFSQEEKVQQFLVENVARLKMSASDRALLVAKARARGEETKSVARRFGVSPATVRRLEQQLSGASKVELRALQRGALNLAVQSVVARHAAEDDRREMVRIIRSRTVPASKLEAVLRAIGWEDLNSLGPDHHRDRIALWRWLLDETQWRAPLAEALEQMAARFPTALPAHRQEVAG